MIYDLEYKIEDLLPGIEFTLFRELVGMHKKINEIIDYLNGFVPDSRQLDNGSNDYIRCDGTRYQIVETTIFEQLLNDSIDKFVNNYRKVLNNGNTLAMMETINEFVTSDQFKSYLNDYIKSGDCHK